MQNNNPNNYDLNKFLNDLNIKDGLNVEEDLGNGFVRLKISEAERRQALQDIKSVEDIIVELLRNSRDAGSKNIFIATRKNSAKKRVVYCIDDGLGIPPRFHNLIFESRVTSKLENGRKDPYGFHGRGMALFSIKLNADVVKITFSDYRKGCCIFLDIDLNKIPEKIDQSLNPQIIETDEGIKLSGGINNIIKIIMEFALQNKNINFYYGTPSQIIATIRKIFTKNGDTEPGKIIKSFDGFIDCISTSEMNIMNCLPLIHDCDLLGEITEKIFNMDISHRNIQRIIYNEMVILNSICGECLKNEKIKDVVKDTTAVIAKPSIKLYDEANLANRFKDNELRCIINMLEKEFVRYGSKYFVALNNNIELKKHNNTINITINLKQKD
jgi:hypothetical protein